eukprot:443572_1
MALSAVFVVWLSCHLTYSAHYAFVKSGLPEEGQPIQEEDVFSSRNDLSITRVVGIQVNLHMHNQHDEITTPNPLPEAEVDEPPMLSVTDSMDMNEINEALEITFRRLETALPLHSVDLSNLKILFGKLEHNLNSQPCNCAGHAESNKTENQTTHVTDNDSSEESREREGDREEGQDSSQHVHVLLQPSNAESVHDQDSESNEIHSQESAERKEKEREDLQSPTNEGEIMVEMVQNLIINNQNHSQSNESETIHSETTSDSETPKDEMQNNASHEYSHQKETANHSESAESKDTSLTDSEESTNDSVSGSHNAESDNESSADLKTNDNTEERNATTIQIETGAEAESTSKPSADSEEVNNIATHNATTPIERADDAKHNHIGQEQEEESKEELITKLQPH